MIRTTLAEPAEVAAARKVVRAYQEAVGEQRQAAEQACTEALVTEYVGKRFHVEIEGVVTHYDSERFEVEFTARLMGAINARAGFGALRGELHWSNGVVTHGVSIYETDIVE